MSTPESTDESAPSEHQDRLDAVIAEYLEAVEAGREPDRDRLVDAHPELADELREFFADQQRMKDFAKHIPAPAAAHQETIVPQRLRYFGDELLEEIGRGGQGWKYDMLSQIWASPLIADGKIYLGDDDGDVVVFRLSADPRVAMKKVGGRLRPIAENTMDNYIRGSAVVANHVLYIHTSNRLYAIALPRKTVARPPSSP